MVNCSMRVKGARSCIFHEMVNCTMVVGNLICYQSSKRNLNCGTCMVNCSMGGGRSSFGCRPWIRNPKFSCRTAVPSWSTQFHLFVPWASARSIKKCVKIVSVVVAMVVVSVAAAVAEAVLLPSFFAFFLSPFLASFSLPFFLSSLLPDLPRSIVICC